MGLLGLLGLTLAPPPYVWSCTCGGHILPYAPGIVRCDVCDRVWKLVEIRGVAK